MVSVLIAKTMDYTNSVDMVYCEGGELPLVADPSQRLALECWNLRKRVIEDEASISNLLRQLRSSKNLIKNLQHSINDLQRENNEKTKESKESLDQLCVSEKKGREMSSLNSNLKLNISQNKRIIAEQDAKIKSLVSEKTKSNAAYEEQIAIETAEHQVRETKLKEQIRVLLEEKKQLKETVSSQDNLLNSNAETIANLQHNIEELKSHVETAESIQSETETCLNEELEQAYESLHSKLEKLWSDRDKYWTQLQIANHENTQLMSFILTEGLETPALPPLRHIPPPPDNETD